MEPSNEPQFEAEVCVLGRFWYIDRHGSATISKGQLTLRKVTGDVIVEAPLSEVWARKTPGGGYGVRIFSGGDSYMIRGPGRVLFLTRESRDVAKKWQELPRQFLSVLEAEGGHLGKPS